MGMDASEGNEAATQIGSRALDEDGALLLARAAS